MKNKKLLLGVMTIMGVSLMMTSLQAMDVSFKSHCSKDTMCSKKMGSSIKIDSKAMEQRAMFSKDDLSHKKTAASQSMLFQKNKLSGFKSVLTPSFFGLELGQQYYGVKQINDFHLGSGPTVGLKSAWQIKKRPFYIQSLFLYGKHYAKGSKDIQGVHSTTKETVFATIQKEKSYESFQYRLGVEYRQSFHEKLEYVVNGGFNYVATAFNFDLKSISGNQDPAFFTFPENNHQYGVGIYFGFGVSYSFAKEYALTALLDYSDVKNNQDENLLGSRISFMISKGI
ncbi:MAG: hypothetical protein VW378_06015 [bacterium]